MLRTLLDKVFGQHTLTLYFHESCCEEWYDGACSCGESFDSGTERDVTIAWRRHVKGVS